MSSEKETLNVRFVNIKGVRYLRADDVVEYILGLSAGEETDVRNRLKAGAKNLTQIK